jgi:hypothetical protein
VAKNGDGFLKCKCHGACIEKIESGGKVTYEVEYMKDGKELDAYFTEDGQPVKGAQ